MRTDVQRMGFHAGQVQDRFRANQSDGVWRNGCVTLKNASLGLAGDAQLRAGTRALNVYGKRILPFVFSEDQAYIVSVDEDRVYVQTLDGTLVFNSGVQDWLDPWATMDYAQSGDVMVFFPGTRMKILTRTAADTFTLTDWEFERGPYENTVEAPFSRYEAKGVALLPSADTGAITLTATKDGVAYEMFDASWIGRVVRIRGRQVEITGLTASPTTDVAQATVREELIQDSRLYLYPAEAVTKYAVGEQIIGVDTGALATISSINTTDGYLSVVMDSGVFLTLSVDTRPNKPGAANNEMIDSVTNAPKQSQLWFKAIEDPIATEEWDEQAWSDGRGWPRTATFFGGRLWAANTEWNPSGIWGSRSGAFFNFDAGDGDDADAVSYSLYHEGVVEILEMVAHGTLLIHCDAKSFWQPTFETEAVTPSNFSPRVFSQHGTRRGVKSASVSFFSLHPASKGKVCVADRYDDNVRAYVSINMSAITSVLSAPIKDMATREAGVADRPEIQCFCVLTDGKIATLTFSPETERFGWVEWSNDQISFDYVEEINGDIFFYGTSGGQPRLMQLDPDAYLDMAYDVAVTPGQTTLSLDQSILNALGGRTVRIHGYASNNSSQPAFHIGDYLCPLTGDLEINYHDCTALTIGLGYELEITPLPLDLETANFSGRSRPKEIVRTSAATNNTVAIELNDRLYWFGPDYSAAGLDLQRRDLEQYMLGTRLILEARVRSVANMPIHLLQIAASVGVK